jgi:hypothetical protein
MVFSWWLCLDVWRVFLGYLTRALSHGESVLVSAHDSIRGRKRHFGVRQPLLQQVFATTVVEILQTLENVSPVLERAG